VLTVLLGLRHGKNFVRLAALLILRCFSLVQLLLEQHASCELRLVPEAGRHSSVQELHQHYAEIHLPVLCGFHSHLLTRVCV
jgi:hypothetical protein